jgi:hypothetical protein
VITPTTGETEEKRDNKLLVIKQQRGKQQQKNREIETLVGNGRGRSVRI